MPYIGRDLSQGNYLKLDDISSQFDGSKVSFDLKTGGTAFFPGSSMALLVGLGGILQEAEAAYTIDQSSIEFASAPANGISCFIIVLGTSIGVSVPADASVTLPKLAQSALDRLSSVGIQSGGTTIGAGVTFINFVQSGLTASVASGIATVNLGGKTNEEIQDIVGAMFSGNTETNITVTYQDSDGTIDLEVAGAGRFVEANSGIHTLSNVGIKTAAFPTEMVGAGNSFQGLYISNGMTIYDNSLNGNHYISTNFNGLMAGPVTVNGVLTVDGNYVVV
tara:strand:- start:239 stop:1072 length:834 start_codon:yes stop_codon:yes gene_type:complete